MARRGGVRRLVAAWIAYWVVLAAVTFGRAAVIVWRVSRPGGRGSMSLGFEDGVLRATVVDGARTMWQGTATFTTAALWLVIPPLIIWALWLALQPPANALPNDATLPRSAPRPRELRDGDAVPLVRTPAGGVSSRPRDR